MAKKPEARIVVASGDLQGLVDRGGEVDRELKNFTFEDKGIKTKITEAAEKVLEGSETSIKLEGQTTVATVTKVEKMELDASSEAYKDVDVALRSGAFGDAVKVRRSLMIPPENVVAAYNVLKQAGIDTIINVEYEVVPQECRVLLGSTTSSTVQKGLNEALGKCLKSKATFRVSYSGK